jgi:hypothetical protein
MAEWSCCMPAKPLSELTAKLRVMRNWPRPPTDELHEGAAG